ncbi:hypothetical protein [Oceanobacillus picturae]|uniref:hypothetical protein n=1 Tax=Oceanobacillus picturae TaxID=171693 RepID=UPI000E679A9E|nr:hypothetical protein [Oceanobacillus picturae]RIU92001.1 hypothetical protein D1864_10275 [Oceanobacillus picturae]
MKQRIKIIRAVKYTGAVILTAGILIFLYGFFISDRSLWTGVGIGTVMGAVFLFLMGVFFVGTEEKLKERYGKLDSKTKDSE